MTCSIVVSASGDPLRIGVLANRGDEAAMERWGPTIDYLDAGFPEKDVVLVPMDFGQMTSEVANEQIDFLITNPLVYVELEVDHNVQRIATLKESWGGRSYTVFGSVIFTKNDRIDVNSLNDVESLSVMAVNEHSFGGWWMAAREFNDAGLDIDAMDVTYGGTEDKVVEAVLSGEVDVGIVSTGILESMKKEGKISFVDIKCLNVDHSPGLHEGDNFDSSFLQKHSTRLYPQWAFSRTSHVSEDVAEKMLSNLLQLPRFSKAALRGGYGGWTVPLDYGPVHECMKELRLGPYENYGEVALSDVINQYWYVFLLMGITTVTLAGASQAVNNKNRRLQVEIDQRDRAEQEKKERDKQLELIISNFPNGIVVLHDSDLRYISIGGKMLDKLNFNKKDFIGKLPEEVLSKDILDTLLPHLYAALDGETRRFEFSIGGYQVEETLLPLEKSNGNLVIVGVLYNMTERKNIEEALNHAKMAAEQANRSKSEFLANMSHELRTPLNSVIGFSDILLEEVRGDLNDPQKKYVSNIAKSGKHLLNLINDILDLSKVEAGKMELECEAFSLTEASKEVMELVMPLGNKKSLSLSVEHNYSEEICADKGKFKQILYNLLSNAIKFTPEGGRVRLLSHVENDVLQVSVSDTGVGISEKAQDTLFDAFTQEDTSSSRNYEGTGLGLSLVKKFVNMHGGDVWVTSKKGEGSTFTFTIPLSQVSCEGNPEETREGEYVIDSNPQAPENTDIDPFPLLEKPLNSSNNEPIVMVVEDDYSSRNLLVSTVVNAGYRALPLSRGYLVSRYVDVVKPFAILLDIMMPGVNGWDVLARLKKSSDTAGIPVIIVSVLNANAIKKEYDISAYIPKPIDRERLLTVLDGFGGSSGSSSSILVVDDDPSAVEMLRSSLGIEGYNVIPAYGGQEAIDKTFSYSPDLIILDLMMPVTSGFDVMAALRGNSNTADIPIIIHTARDMENKGVFEGNVVSILQKGAFTRTHLIEIIKHLDSRRNHGGSASND
ncbi:MULTISPECIES: PhnD/SsuA/transferrin family substrate-binding protein [Methanohalophilus]|uniref:PhnD/SsuA/transferrin family substrate-binding protein n=1 Tax=Methanohalophilus TaxID=2175 RepID=UPI001403199F|nr:MULTISPECIES: PhnD/SsuA/transferrin family substrate-binding protein [Methanohalophilus]